MEPEDYLIWLYLEVEALYCDLFSGLRLRKRGFPPALSDVELLTLELFGEYKGLDNDRAIWRYVHEHWLDWFPNLGSYKTFTKHSANLMVVKQHIFARLSKASQSDSYYLADGLPMRVCRFARAKRCKLFPEKATFGFCAAQKETYYGFKGMLVTADNGMIRGFNLVPANCDERQALLDMELPVKGHLLADKGFIGKDFQQKMRKENITVHTPMRDNMTDDRPKEWVKTLMNKRRYIESLIAKLTDQFSLARIRARNI